MFKKARLRLTGWYLLIIMLISIFFSVIIYQTTSVELERGYHRAIIEQKANELGIQLPRNLPRRLENIDPRLSEFLLIEGLQEAKNRIKTNLFIINGVILLVSTAAGYILAGQTLKPIKKTMDEHKRFIADASHELRTPLTALKTSIEVDLRDKKLPLSAKKILKNNLKDVNGLTKLSNNLLSLANHQGYKTIKLEKILINTIIKSVIKKIKPLAQAKKIKLVNKAKTMITLQGDKRQITELVTILLDNAIKYSNKGSKVLIDTKLAKNKLIFTVADNGIGISKKDLAHIFDRFYQAESSRSKTDNDGFGLGLSVAKKIVKQHHGTIKVKSELNKGSTFEIKLPLG